MYVDESTAESNNVPLAGLVRLLSAVETYDIRTVP
jgi:hypothetical protein